MTTINNLQRPRFPHALDNTILSAFRSCPQKAFRTYLQHWKPITESVHLVAGGAFAKGLEVARDTFYVQGRPAAESVESGLDALIRAYGDFECPADSAKSLERTAGALEFYFDRYELGDDPAVPITMPDGRRGIEFSFAEPLDVLHPVTGDPILYTGRSDMVCDYAGGIYIEDDKTTSSLGATWSRQWEMRAQFTGYTWAAHRAGIEVAGCLVRGVSILKTKYDTQEALTYRTGHEIAIWEEQTRRDVLRMIECWQSGWWDYDMGESCASYGGCSMVSVCKSSDPEGYLPVRFQQRVWDPLLRREMTVDQYEASWEGDVYDPEATAAPAISGTGHIPQALSGAHGLPDGQIKLGRQT